MVAFETIKVFRIKRRHCQLKENIGLFNLKNPVRINEIWVSDRTILVLFGNIPVLFGLAMGDFHSITVSPK